MIFHNVYALPLKTVITVMLLVLIVWTIIGGSIKKYKKIWSVINGILLVLFLVVILHLTLFNRSKKESQISFIRTIEHIKAQPELIREMVMNAFLFFPFGLILPYALKSIPCVKNMRPMLITIISALLLSCSIEFIQYLCNIGNAELSDIIMNTLGAAIGSVSYIISTKLSKMR